MQLNPFIPQMPYILKIEPNISLNMQITTIEINQLQPSLNRMYRKSKYGWLYIQIGKRKTNEKI
jgi:hypothetical protein